NEFDLSARERLMRLLSRREFFSRLGTGAGALALATLLGEQARAEAPRRATYDLLPKSPHLPATAKRVIYLFQNGGPSQVDLFDSKPELNKRAGEKPGQGYVNDVDAKKTGVWLGTPFQFVKHGQSGMELSELLPELGKHADEIALVRSMVSEHENHEQACCHMHTGMPQAGRPTMGAWITYGLGTENQNLPAYVALLNPGGLPVDGARNWSSGWMPPVYQGMSVRATESSPILNLEARIPRDAADARLQLLQSLNRDHFQAHADNLELEARIANFELAARMQLAATDALDLSKESAMTRTLYGLDKNETAVYGRQCLMARRLVERGVRFVQVMMAGQPWDTHSDNANQLRSLCRSTDGPVSALLSDLKQRGLLEETLVIWTGEFGRTPFAEGKDGRDHHKRGFSLWVAGGGVKGGVTHGATDEFGYQAVQDVVTVADFHATLLYLLGLDFQRLTFRHDTRDERLTDVHQAKIIEPILAKKV
ncbi:MAG TPA: DUF1501 domain-containing protein, partial [Chthonomonadaceae bacterium]|nr:DUF1501 domain-containing protein [Chthonomonadaceae bacterium]